MNKRRQAFTLVELIVVITILAILGTIAFISLQGFSKDARNATRGTDLKNIETVLGLYHLKEGSFPLPSNPNNITYSGGTVWTQGTFGENTRKLLGGKGQISEIPIDPLTGSEYTYSILENRQEMSIAGVFEGDYYTSTLNKLNNSYAAGEYGTTYIKGNYNGKVAKTTTGAVTYVLAVPSIISGDNTLIDLIEILNNKKLAYNNSHIIPSSYSGQTVFQETLPTGNIVNTGSIVVFSSGSLNGLVHEVKQQEFIDNLISAYSGTTTSTQSGINKIISNNTLYTAQVLIKNNILPKLTITESNQILYSAIANSCLEMTQENVDKLNIFFNGYGYNGDVNYWCGLTSIAVYFTKIYDTPLTGNIPKELGNLTNLTNLNLQVNQLTGTIPKELGNLINLNYLYLNGNQLTGNIPAQIGNLANLIGVTFAINQLTGTIPKELGNLNNLNYLDLNGNQLTGSIPVEIGNLTNLINLELSGNTSSFGNLEYDFDENTSNRTDGVLTIGGNGTNIVITIN